jgi:hypothetical protein
VLSLLVQVTVLPTETLMGLGEYADEVSTEAPATIDTPCPVVVDGDVGVEDDELPQA